MTIKVSVSNEELADKYYGVTSEPHQLAPKVLEVKLGERFDGKTVEDIIYLKPKERKEFYLFGNRELRIVAMPINVVQS